MSALLEGKTAIVTGAAGGIGRVVVDGLVEAGAAVVASDVNDAALEDLEKEMREKYPAAELACQHVDVADYAACVHSVQGAIERFGGLHILINNAALGLGIIREDHFSRPIGIQEIEPEIWQRMVAVNFSGAWNMTRAAIGYLLDQKWGRIINVTTSFFTMLRAGFHPYSPAKAGLESMSLGHSQEFEGTGVTVNVVVPGGPTDTAMVPDDIGVARSELIAPSAMVPPIVWLCSDAAQAISGNRYVAAQWDTSLSAQEAEKACRAPAAWPQLAQSPVWPGGKPSR